MSAKTVFINAGVWSEVSPSVRRAVLAILPRENVLNRYASNVESDIRGYGEDYVADVLLDGIEQVLFARRQD